MSVLMCGMGWVNIVVMRVAAVFAGMIWFAGRVGMGSIVDRMGEGLAWRWIELGVGFGWLWDP